MTPDLMALEGRINAHRRLLVSLVALLKTAPEAQDLLRRLQVEQETHRDHEEDPGIEPDETYAVQRIAAEEVMNIIGAGMTRNASVKGRNPSEEQLEMTKVHGEKG